MSDDERFKWLSGMDACSFHLAKDSDHTTNYMTAKEWIETCAAEDFEDTDDDLVHEMKEKNSIWKLQVYPNTPIGFYVFYGPSMESVVDQAMECDDLEDRS